MDHLADTGGQSPCDRLQTQEFYHVPLEACNIDFSNRKMEAAK
jgi:hypothetical protein